MRGRKLPRDVVEKIRLANTGQKRSIEFKENARLNKLGDRNPSYGKKYTIEERLRLSESVRKAKAPLVDRVFQAELHAVRHSAQSRMWRELVFGRDNYTCVWCGDNRGGNLEADHIKPFILIIRQNDIRTLQEALNCQELWDIENGRTLCITCHRTTDTWGAKVR